MLKNFSQQTFVVEGFNKAEIIDSIKTDAVSVFGEDKCEFFPYDYESLSIDSARNLKSLYREKNGDNLVFYFLSFSSIPKDASNTLLKMIEEPGEGVYFFIIVPNKNILLKTILSRCGSYDIKNNSKFLPQDYKEISLRFIKSELPERLNIINTFIEKEKDEDDSSVLNNRSLLFVNMLGEAGESIEKDERKIAFFESIMMANKYLRMKGSSAKMLLENCAVSLS